jgi:DNA-binding CsgD family transcriptional regulator
MLPSRQVLEHVATLIRCDAVVVQVAEQGGSPVDSVRWPCEQRGEKEPARGASRPDEFVLAFANGRDHLAQLRLTPGGRAFCERDVAVLRMIAPLLERMLRSLPTATAVATLTAQERRVLQLVGTGLSNTEIADRLYVAPCTVRKHLEHAFRKLGVTNRLAAVIAFERGDQADTDRVDTGRYDGTRIGTARRGG